MASETWTIECSFSLLTIRASAWRAKKGQLRMHAAQQTASLPVCVQAPW